MAQVPIRQGHSDEIPRHFVHNRFNCASSFQSLASHLTKTMNLESPDKPTALKWIRDCIRARRISTQKRKDSGKPTDLSHQAIINMLSRLLVYVELNIHKGAEFSFRQHPEFRFWVRSYDNTKKATIYSDRIVFNRLEGGRKSTRKNRKTNRKTYRILPKVEGS